MSWNGPLALVQANVCVCQAGGGGGEARGVGWPLLCTKNGATAADLNAGGGGKAFKARPQLGEGFIYRPGRIRASIWHDQGFRSPASWGCGAPRGPPTCASSCRGGHCRSAAYGAAHRPHGSSSEADDGLGSAARLVQGCRP